MTKEVMERMLWLSLLELPWSEARQAIRDEMGRVGMTHDDLYVALRGAGVDITRGTVGRWLRGEGRGPALDGLRAIVGVLAEAGSGDSPKASLFSPPAPAYALGPESGIVPHAPYLRLSKMRSQGREATNQPKDLEHPPAGGHKHRSSVPSAA